MISHLKGERNLMEKLFHSFYSRESNKNKNLKKNNRQILAVFFLIIQIFFLEAYRRRKTAKFAENMIFWEFVDPTQPLFVRFDKYKWHFIKVFSDSTEDKLLICI